MLRIGFFSVAKLAKSFGIPRSSKKFFQEFSATAFLVFLCFGQLCNRALAQPENETPQWKQSIERPSRDWDYDGQRILGHLGHDICLWDATTGKLLQRMKEHKERIKAVQLSPNGKQWLRIHNLRRKKRQTNPRSQAAKKSRRTSEPVSEHMVVNTGVLSCVN
jgi:hypothetical protein